MDSVGLGKGYHSGEHYERIFYHMYLAFELFNHEMKCLLMLYVRFMMSIRSMKKRWAKKWMRKCLEKK